MSEPIMDRRRMREAFEHIRHFYPDVVRVNYDEDVRWIFTDDGNEAPTFDGQINDAILEAAADEAYELAKLPAIFVYDPLTGQVSAEEV